VAIVVHNIHGNKYAYWHHRMGDKVKTDYLGQYDVNTSSVMDNGFRKVPGYEERHRWASNQEKIEYPKTFDKLMTVINKRLEPGELAGKYHEEDGIVKIDINDKIPKTYHDQIRDHELIEHYRDITSDKQQNGAYYGYKGKQQEQTIQKAMKHKAVPGSGASKRRSIRSAQTKYEIVMREFHRGTLFSSSGKKVHDVNQAQAIAYSEARNVDPDYGK
jgi:hypothetical protein